MIIIDGLKKIWRNWTGEVEIAIAIPKKELMDMGWKLDESILVIVTKSEILLRKKDAFKKEKYKKDIEVFQEVLDSLGAEEKDSRGSRSEMER